MVEAWRTIEKYRTRLIVNAIVSGERKHARLIVNAIVGEFTRLGMNGIVNYVEKIKEKEEPKKEMHKSL